MATLRISDRSDAPTTDYNLYADLASQNQAGNYSTIYYWVQAINRGGTGSFSNNNGSQVGVIAGGGGSGHSGTMPSGYATGQQRWYNGPYAVNVPHNAEGIVGAISVVQRVRGWFTMDQATTMPAPPRIPKPPTVPGTPVASEILPTSMRLTWTASTDSRGSAIDHYLVRIYETADGTGPYVDNIANNLTRVIEGLKPGQQYSFRVYAHNGSSGGYSPTSGILAVATLAPVWVKVGGVWKYGIPYVKVNGKWVSGLPYVKRADIWQLPN